MADGVVLDELSGMSAEQAFRELFRAHDAVPMRLFDPAQALARADDSSRTAEARVADLGIMSRDTESIFREYLSPLSVENSQPQLASMAWPIALARWTELLHHRANLILERDILPELVQGGFRILSVAEATDQHGDWIRAHFQEHIYPLLTPLAVDPGRPFPHISSDSLNLLVELQGGVRHEPAALIARVKIPSITPRLIRLPASADSHASPREARTAQAHIWSVDLVRHYMTELFVDIPIRRIFCFRVLRTSEALSMGESPARDVRGRRARGSVVRVDVESAMPPVLFDWLVDHLDVISYSVVRYDSPDAAMSLPQLAAAVQRWATGAQPASNP